MEKSKDFNAKDASIKVVELESPEDILAFIGDDEDRKVVLAAADKRLRELGHEGLNLEPEKAKQGETGAITKETGDFKNGVEGTKVAPQEEAEPGEKKVATCEDVIKRMRAEGKKI